MTDDERMELVAKQFELRSAALAVRYCRGPHTRLKPLEKEEMNSLVRMANEIMNKVREADHA